MKERKLKVDEDLFAWWRNRRDEYPQMSKLARKYLAVQGTLTPAERVISKLGAVLTKRRQSFAAESLAAPIIGSELRYWGKWLICSDLTFTKGTTL